MWDSESEENFEKTKILMKQIKALDIFQAGLPFEADVSVTLEDMGQALWQRQQKERVPLGFWSQLRKEAETRYTHTE